MQGSGVRSLMSCLVDDDLTICDVDDGYAAAIGRVRDDVIGCHLPDLLHADDRAAFSERLHLLCVDGRGFSTTLRLAGHETRRVWLTHHVSLLQLGSWRRASMTVAYEDVPPVDDERRVLKRAAERILGKRRLRERYLGSAVVGEPAFDLLLELFVQEAEGRAVYTTSAAVASGAPLTTALRQIAMLVESGLVRRLPDPIDRRRVIVQLTPEGMRTMTDYLAATQRV